MYKAANCSIVTLLPKHNEGKSIIKDYRSIPCCSTLYNIISKVLANRISQVLGIIVGQNHVAFVNRQKIHNHILLTYELIKEYGRIGGTPRCFIQMDIQKACEMVDWSALESILNEVGFPEKFTNWIMISFSSVSYRFNINGQYTRIIEAKRGLRQGNPISLLLFVIIMEILNRYLHKMQKDSNFNFHPKCKRLSVTNLCFVGDLLLFSRGNEISVSLMINTFQKFSKAKRMKFNLQKCHIYYAGMDRDNKEVLGKITEFKKGQFPFKYLGLPVTSKRLPIHYYMSLVDQIVGEIKHLSARLFSYAGRLQLIKIIIFTLTNYWLQ